MTLLTDAILGLAVGDALGVPVEFVSRLELKQKKVADMLEYGTHKQPKGTWSDDTSLTLCLLDSLKNGINYKDIMERFVKWRYYGEYTAHGKAFDVGVSTNKAVLNYVKKITPTKCGGTAEHDNGNGSLMRILPLAFIHENKRLTKSNFCCLNNEKEQNDIKEQNNIKEQNDIKKENNIKKYNDIIEQNNIKEQMKLVHDISSLTHGHKRSLIACGIYIMIAKELIAFRQSNKTIDEVLKNNTIEQGIKKAISYYSCNEEFNKELLHYRRLTDFVNFKKLKEEEIKSSGYVVDTLEAAIWCFLTTNSYETCVLKAVNLGDDTDTIGAVTGGLAGIWYGSKNIPDKWLNVLARKEYIIELCKLD